MISAFFNFLKDWAAVIFPIIVGCYCLIRRILHDPRSRSDWAVWLRHPLVWEGYTTVVKRGLDWLDGFFGEPRSGRAFRRCWLIAFLYPSFLFLLSWVFEGPKHFKTETFLIEASQTRRILDGFVVYAIGFVIFFIVRRRRHWAELLVRRLPASWRFKEGLGIIVELGIIFGAILGAGTVALTAFFAGAVLDTGAVTVASTVAVALAAAFADTGAVTVAFASTVAVALAAAFAGTGAVAVTFAVAVAVAISFAVAFAVLGAGTGIGAVIWLLAFLLFPLLNAILDWLSWWVSRSLIRKVTQDPSHRRIFIHLGLDLFWAAVFLVSLAALIPIEVQAANRAFSAAGWPVIEWQGNLAAVKTAPFTRGIVLWGMLLTTLVPTALHLLVATTALVLKWPMPGKLKIAGLLEEEDLSTGKLVGAELWFTTALILGIIILIGVPYWMLKGIAFMGLNIGGLIYEVVKWSGTLVGGPGLPGF